MVEKFTETFDRLGSNFINKLYEYSANNEDIDFFSLNRRHALDVVWAVRYEYFFYFLFDLSEL